MFVVVIVIHLLFHIFVQQWREDKNQMEEKEKEENKNKRESVTPLGIKQKLGNEKEKEK